MGGLRSQPIVSENGEPGAACVTTAQWIFWVGEVPLYQRALCHACATASGNNCSYDSLWEDQKTRGVSLGSKLECPSLSSLLANEELKRLVESLRPGAGKSARCYVTEKGRANVGWGTNSQQCDWRTKEPRGRRGSSSFKRSEVLDSCAGLWASLPLILIGSCRVNL